MAAAHKETYDYGWQMSCCMLVDKLKDEVYSSTGHGSEVLHDARSLGVWVETALGGSLEIRNVRLGRVRSVLQSLSVGSDSSYVKFTTTTTTTTTTEGTTTTEEGRKPSGDSSNTWKFVLAACVALIVVPRQPTKANTGPAFSDGGRGRALPANVTDVKRLACETYKQPLFGLHRTTATSNAHLERSWAAGDDDEEEQQEEHYHGGDGGDD
eukprot:s772_g8.t1